MDLDPPAEAGDYVALVFAESDLRLYCREVVFI